MARLIEQRRTLEHELETARGKRELVKAGFEPAEDQFTAREAYLADVPRGMPVVEGPWVVDFMSESEIEEEAERARRMGTPPTAGYCCPELKTIILRREVDMPYEALGGKTPRSPESVFRHELGHAKTVRPIYVGPSDIKAFADDMLREVTAEYFALSVDPDDEFARKNIATLFGSALQAEDLEPIHVYKLEKVAMEMAGYTGRPVYGVRAFTYQAW